MLLWRVYNVMSTDVAGSIPDMPLRDIIGVLEGRAAIVPVVDKSQRVVGVVCDGDVRRWRASRRRADGDLATDDTVAGELMSAPAWTVDAQALLTEAAKRMHCRKVSHLPVTGEGGRLVGVVSATDLLRAFGRLDTEIRADLIEHVLRRTMYVDPDQVHVAVRDGEVILAGTIERRSAVAVAERLAYTVPGVVHVVNRLNYEYDDTPFPAEETLCPTEWCPQPAPWEEWTPLRSTDALDGWTTSPKVANPVGS